MIDDIKAALEILNSLKDLIPPLRSSTQNHPQEALKTRLVELNNLLIAAQENQLAMTKRIRQLEEQVGQMKDWAEEKKRYELRRVGIDGQMLVYVLRKPFVQQGETPHEICAPCAEDGKKSYLTHTPAGLMRPESPTLLLTCPVHDVTMISVHSDQLLPA